MGISLTILLQLLLAHIFTDFVLQPKSWIIHKRKYKGKSYILILHSLLAGILSLIFLQDIGLWYLALIISISHYLIDWWKLAQSKDNLRYFLLDQLFHIIIILLAWLYLINGFNVIFTVIIIFFYYISLLSNAFSFLLVIFPAGYYIASAT